MAMLEHLLQKLKIDPLFAKSIGLDSTSPQEVNNFAILMKQMEGYALNIKEKSFDDLIKIGMDSEGLYRARSLEFFDPRFYEFEHKMLNFRELFPISHMADPADKTTTYEMEKLVGKAEFTGEVSNTQTQVDVIAKEVTDKIYKGQVEFSITTDDLRSAIKTGRPIESRKMKAAFRAAEEIMHDTVILGNVEAGIKGFINHSDIVKAEVLDGAGGGNPKLWDNKTPEEILQIDIGAPLALIAEQTFNRHHPTHMGISIERYNHLKLRWIATITPMPLLKWLMEMISVYGLEEIVPMPELNGTGPGGTELGIFWEKDDNVLEVDIPMELVWIAPQFVGTVIKFIGEFKISDLKLRRKQAVRMFYGH